MEATMTRNAIFFKLAICIGMVPRLTSAAWSASSTLSNMPAALPLSGAELVYGVQGSLDKKITTQQFRDYFQSNFNLSGKAADQASATIGALTRPISDILHDFGDSPQHEGASGSDQNTTGSIAAGSSILTLVSAIDFKIGQGIRIDHAGTPFAGTTPTGLTVSAQGTAGTTSYAYQISCLDNYGGVGAATGAVSITNGNAVLNATNTGNYNALTWSGTCAAYAIYRNGALVGTSPTASYNDYGKGPGGFSNLSVPEWLPTAPQVTALADWLVTSVTAGAGTNSLTLAAAAVSSASSQYVLHDDTAAFIAALAPGALRTKNTVFLPCGVYHITSTLPITQQQTSTHGLGQCSDIKKDSIASDLFAAVNANFNDWSDFLIEAPVVQTSGYLFNLNSGGSSNNINRIVANGGWSDVYIPSGGAQNTITNSVLNNQINNGIMWDTGYGGLDSVSNVMIGTDAYYNIGVGLYVKSASTLNWSNLNIAGQYIPILIAPAAGKTVEDLQVVNVAADGCGGGCRPPSAGAKARFIVDGSAAGSTAHRIRCTNCWAGAGPAEGFQFFYADDITCAPCHSQANGKDGVLITNSTDIKLGMVNIRGNGLNAPGTYYGVEINGTGGHHNITGGRIGPVTGSAATQQNALATGGSPLDYISVSGVDGSGNIGGAWNIAAGVAHQSVTGGF